MLHLRPVVVTVLLGLLMTMTQAPAQAADGYLDAPAPTATLAAPMAGEVFQLTGQIPEVHGALNPQVVHLWRLDNGKWSRLGNVPSANGSYSFPVRITRSTRFRVSAYTARGGVVSWSRVVSVASQYVAASVQRNCATNNECGGAATYLGYVKPVRPGRSVVLQYRAGSDWKSILSSRGHTDANGKFEITFPITGWSQWSAKQLRVAAGSFNQSTSGVSAPMSFMPGPRKIGANVLRIDVAGGVFPTQKGVDHTGYATLSQNGQVTINRARLDKFGVRGSTTAGYPKKPYNLRFVNSPPTDVFGMDADKRWTLLAMYADQSYVRDKTALDLGRKLTATGHGMSWNADSRYVELFVNSEYKGAYLLTEKVNIDGDKVDIGKNTGMIMETDMDTVSDPRKGFMTARSRLIFAFKDPDGYGGADGITSGKLSAIKNKLAAVESYLYTSNRKYYYKQLDRDSAADFYLAQEFIKDTDADFWRSKYFSWDTARACGNELCNGLLHFGPLWDFDKSIGNIDATNPATAFIRSYRGWHANGTGIGKPHHVTYHTHWFAQLWKEPSFRGYLKHRWNNDEIRKEFWRAAEYDVEQNRAEIGVGADNDRARWAGASKLYKPKGSSYNDEVRYVKSWLLNRFNWMDSQL